MTRPARTVAIACFPESAHRYVDAFTIVGIDVIRATTTALTALAQGRRCFPVPSIEEAVPLAARLERPLLVGELGGSLPYGFDLNNSPAQLAPRTDTERPMILLSTSGTRLLAEAASADAVYAACLRNRSATVARLVAHHPHVAIIGAGARGEFREEDQYCCAWIAEGLLDAGYEPWDDATADVVERWRGEPATAFADNKSAAYLRDTGQEDDLDFVLGHVDDLDIACRLVDGELVVA
jgi:2-phosphosulfolactate phosphatase